MFNRFKNALFTVVGGLDAIGRDNEGINEHHLPLKFPYSRPSFLQFSTEEEMLVSVDHAVRPIIVPRNIANLPWNSGYAEAINAGKSEWNEDEACIQVGIIRKPNNERNDVSVNVVEDSCNCLPYVYFAVFDGHAGSGASVAACRTLHKIVEEKLISVADLLLISSPTDAEEPKQNSGYNTWFPERYISKDNLVIGALEAAFWEMDSLIEQDKQKYHMTGGCTALVALFIMGKLYVANAGDSRAVLCKNEKAIAMSQDFTPETERQRIRGLAFARPDLLGGEYTAKEFSRRLTRKDIGKPVLCREETMVGWSYKTVSSDDIKFPLVYGEGKRSRVLATIGVTRGFGDHDLKAQNSNINIKPFLTPQPEVYIFDIANEEVAESDVLIMGTDGLWDITSSEKAVDVVITTLNQFSCKEDPRYQYRFVSAAQDLVMNSRGKLREKSWRTALGKPATIDDITVFVIPLLPYKEEFRQLQEAKTFISNICLENSHSPVLDGEEVMES